VHRMVPPRALSCCERNVSLPNCVANTEPVCSVWSLLRDPHRCRPAVQTIGIRNPRHPRREREQSFRRSRCPLWRGRRNRARALALARFDRPRSRDFITTAVFKPRAGKSSTGVSHGWGGLAGKSISKLSGSKPSCFWATVSMPLQVWKRTGHTLCFRSAST